MIQPRIRILMASSVHLWNDVRVYHKETLSLAKIADVHLVAVQADGAPQAPNGRIAVDFLPAKGLDNGQGDPIGLRIYRVANILKQVLEGKYDVFHFHDPELIPVGWIAKLRGKKVIYDVHEDYKSAWATRDWMSRPMAMLLGWVGRACERLSLRVFDRFILAESSYNSFLRSQKCQVVQNYQHAPRCYSPVPRAEDESLKLVYAGGLTPARGVADIIDAVSQLHLAGHNITLDLFGNSASTSILHQIRQGQSGTWLSYHGFLPYPRLIERLPNYHVGLSPLRNHPNYSHSLPTKMLDYMAAGLAVVASNLPRTAEIATETDGVIMHEPGNLGDFQQCIRALLDEPTRLKLAWSGSRAVGRYTWGSQEAILLRLYEGMFT